MAYTRVVLKLRTQAARMTKNFETMMQPPVPTHVQENWIYKNHLLTEHCDNASLVVPVQERELSLNGSKITDKCDDTLLNSSHPENNTILSENRDVGHYAERNYFALQMVDKQSFASPLPPRKVPTSGGSKRKKRHFHFNSSKRHKEARRLEHNTKIVKMLLSVVLLYAICLLPNQVVWLWYEFGAGQTWPHINELLVFGSLMVYINSSVNPLLYAGMNTEFRKGFARILRCQWKERKPEHL